jgi:hypothetical protein
MNLSYRGKYTDDTTHASHYAPGDEARQVMKRGKCDVQQAFQRMLYTSGCAR